MLWLYFDQIKRPFLGGISICTAHFPSIYCECIPIAFLVSQCCLEAGDGILQDASYILRFLSIGGAAYLGFDENSFTDDSIFTF